MNYLASNWIHFPIPCISVFATILIPQATITYFQFGPYIKPYTALTRVESEADVLLGLDADVEVRAQCQAEGLVGRSMSVIPISQPAPVFLQFSCAIAVGASPWSQIHPNKDEQHVNNKPLRGFILSPRQVISVCCQITKINLNCFCRELEIMKPDFISTV